MRNRIGLWEHLDLPDETIPGEVLVEIAGENRVLIEQHRGVHEYSRERIGVNVRFGIVQVLGSCLELRCMNREQLVISGKIDSVHLVRKGIS